MTTAPAGTPGSVRPALPADAPRIAQVQVDTWRLAYGRVLPETVLAELDAEDAAVAWDAAIGSPPSAAHHVLVAVDSASDAVVGFAALTPADDEDADPVHDGELAVLLVDPAHGHVGHGSRLLAAAVDVWRSQGVTRAVAWALDKDDALQGLLTSAGWAADGSRRTLENPGNGEGIHQLRLHTDLTPSP